jgi:hypothetical protein
MMMGIFASRGWFAFAFVLASIGVALIGCPHFFKGPFVAVAWNTTEGDGFVGLVSARRPWCLLQPVFETGGSTVLASSGRFVYAVSRTEGLITEIDTATGESREVTALGESSQLEDIAVVDAVTAFLTRRNSGRLLRLNLSDGATAESADLSSFADGDGNPDLGGMFAFEGRLFVQIRRTNQDAPNLFAPPAFIGVVDVTTEALVDADLVLDGVQAIELEGTAPKHRMQLVPGTRTLAVSATGGFFDEGGIEIIDLDALTSLGLAIREEDGFTGADLGPFVLTSADTGYLVYSTDLELSSHLQPFSFSGGVELTPGMFVSVGYAVPNMVLNGNAERLFVPDGEFSSRGVFPISTITNEELTNGPVEVSGAPTDILFISAE